MRPDREVNRGQLPIFLTVPSGSPRNRRKTGNCPPFTPAVTGKAARVYVDGSAIGNPGPAGVGVVIECPGGQEIEISEFLGEATNNQAEYRALLRALEECGARSIGEATFLLDSELVVRQIRGEYRVKQAELLALHAQARAALQSGRYRLEQVGRQENRRANVLAQNAARLGQVSPPQASATKEPPSRLGKLRRGKGQSRPPKPGPAPGPTRDGQA